jgi:hypothetical protein
MSTKSLFYFCSALSGIIAGIGTTASAANVSIVETDQSLTVVSQDRTILVYNKQSPPVPKGIDPIYARSGFIHPVMTPKDKTVTDTFPRDHAHQHGIFSAWVKSTYGDRAVDFWNLGGGSGRVLHERVVATSESIDSASFEVDLLHRSEKPTPIDILRERWKVTVFAPTEDYYCFDIESTQQAITETPLLIEKYHYGGMALRGNSKWLTKLDKDPRGQESLVLEPSQFLNDQGQDRIFGNHLPTKWVALTGKLDSLDATIVVLSHSKNFRSPQPARLHGSKPYFCFTPCVDSSFEISQSTPLVSHYRYLVTDQPPDFEWIDQQWEAFTSN